MRAKNIRGWRTLLLVHLLTMLALIPCLGQDTADILEHARPAVVTVTTEDSKGHASGLGSGFIVRSDGVILTAWHVVDGASKAEIKLADDKSYAVKGLLGWDTGKDFALLKVDADDLPTLPLGDSDTMRQGERVLTLGSPLGLEQTASEGIVSAVRNLPKYSLLQITAPISPGNSGGPLLNTRGEVIGITLYRFPEGQALNFALAINEVKAKLAAPGNITPLGSKAMPVIKPHAKHPSQQSTQSAENQRVGTLGEIVRTTPIYRGRSSLTGLLTYAPARTYVAVQGVVGAWYSVLMADGSVGWLRKSSLHLLNFIVTRADILPAGSAGLSGSAVPTGSDPGDVYPRGKALFFTGDAKKLLKEAYKYLGVPYLRGGHTRHGIDAFNFIRKVFAASGYALPGNNVDQIAYGVPVPVSQLRAGDRLYFGRRKDRLGVTHTGLYIGNGYFIHSATSTHGVAISRLDDPRYWRIYVCARR